LQITLKGTVFSGKGEGKKFVALPWVQRQISEKLGFSPFLGTLNLRLSAQNIAKRTQMEKSEGITIAPEKGFFSGKLYPAHIGAIACAVIVPIVPNYPADILEVVAESCLREKLKLEDGDCVSVLVTL
jgi:riboflavin kinase, archaea type